MMHLLTKQLLCIILTSNDDGTFSIDIFRKRKKKLNSFQYLFLDNFSIPGCLWAVRKAWGFWWCFVGRKRSCSHRLHAGRQRKVGRKFEPKTRGKKPNVFSWLYAEWGRKRLSSIARGTFDQEGWSTPARPFGSFLSTLLVFMK